MCVLHGRRPQSERGVGVGALHPAAQQAESCLVFRKRHTAAKRCAVRLPESRRLSAGTRWPSIANHKPAALLQRQRVNNRHNKPLLALKPSPPAYCNKIYHEKLIPERGCLSHNARSTHHRHCVPPLRVCRRNRESSKPWRHCLAG